ncbi:hypothetical protein N7490_009396 [Penicillium lividum]|nr:hypothetical protein N7490_009396 [Penicillium lividum]
MGIDITLLAPGPAGTSMIGESSIDAAARRAYARKQREAEKKLEENHDPTEDKDKDKDKDSAQSEKKLAQSSAQNDKDALGLASTQVTNREGGIWETWKRVRDNFRD